MVGIAHQQFALVFDLCVRPVAAAEDLLSAQELAHLDAILAAVRADPIAWPRLVARAAATEMGERVFGGAEPEQLLEGMLLPIEAAEVAREWLALPLPEDAAAWLAGYIARGKVAIDGYDVADIDMVVATACCAVDIDCPTIRLVGAQ